MFDIYKPRCLIYIAQLFSKKLLESLLLYLHIKIQVYTLVFEFVLAKFYMQVMTITIIIVSATPETAVLGTFHT